MMGVGRPRARCPSQMCARRCGARADVCTVRRVSAVQAREIGALAKRHVPGAAGGARYAPSSAPGALPCAARYGYPSLDASGAPRCGRIGALGGQMRVRAYEEGALWR